MLCQQMHMIGDRLPGGSVQSNRRFVEQQDLRAVDQRPCDLHAPPMSAIEGAHLLIGPLSHAELRQGRIDRQAAWRPDSPCSPAK